MTPSRVRISNSTILAEPRPVVNWTFSLKMSLRSRVILTVLMCALHYDFSLLTAPRSLRGWQSAHPSLDGVSAGRGEADVARRDPHGLPRYDVPQ